MSPSAVGALFKVTLLATLSTACGPELLKPTTTLITNLGNKPSPNSTPMTGPSDGTSATPGKTENATTAGPSSPQQENVEQSGSCSTPALPAKNALNIQFQNLTNVNANLQSLDVYMPAVSNPCQGVPVVIWVHGGAWMLGDKANIDDKGRLFNSLGYGFVSINYRLSPVLRENAQLMDNRIKFPDHPNDVGAAVAWVHKNIKTLGGNPQKLALLGHSAGAHLAALVAMDQSYIQKADSNWTSTSLRCLGSYDTEAYNIVDFMRDAIGQPRLFYRNAFGDDTTVWNVASPIIHIKDYGMAVQLAKRGDLGRQAQLDAFKVALEAKKNSVSVINAQTLSHEEVNRLIGMDGEQIMTPPVKTFVTERCFPM